MAVIAYLRVSTDEQANSGLGMDAQLAAIKAAAGDIDAVYRDDGFSGSDPKRPGLLSAIDSLKNGDLLYVAKRDRLARDTFLSLWLEKEAKRKSARIISAAGEGTGSDDPSSVLMRTLVDAFATYERQLIGQRTAAALQQKKARGEKTGGLVPFGYDVDSDGIRLVPNQKEREAIEIIKELRGRGHTLRAICDELQQRNIKTKTGGKWYPQTVKRALEAA